MSKRFLGMVLGLTLLAGQAMAATVSGENFAPAVAGAYIGDATVRSIAGSGGVLQQRFSQLRAERVASASEFGSNQAMASPYGVYGNSLANRFWASAIYTNIDSDTRGDQVGSGYKYKAWGGALGYDHLFGDFAVGAAFTYSRGDYDAKGIRDDVDVDNYGVSLYAAYYNCSGFFGDVYGGYNYGDMDMRIFDNAWEKASPHTDSYWLGTTLGYDIRVSDNFTLTPTTGLLWMHSETSSFSMGAARYGKAKQKSLLLPVDLAATYTIMLDDCAKLDLTVKGGYAYDFKGNDRTRNTYNIGGAGFTARGFNSGRHNWNIGGGVKYSRERWDIGAEYRYDGRKHYDQHTVAATVGFNF